MIHNMLFGSKSVTSDAKGAKVFLTAFFSIQLIQSTDIRIRHVDQLFSLHSQRNAVNGENVVICQVLTMYVPISP